MVDEGLRKQSMKDRIPVCPHGSSEDIDRDLILALERLERESGLTLKFSSGLRCDDCNAAAGGVKNSAHLRGLAVDTLAGGSVSRFRIISAAVRLGFRRIGIGKTFVHLDIDLNLPQDVLWLY